MIVLKFMSLSTTERIIRKRTNTIRWSNVGACGLLTVVELAAIDCLGCRKEFKLQE
jgi:hypothetical protein